MSTVDGDDTQLQEGYEDTFQAITGASAATVDQWADGVTGFAKSVLDIVEPVGEYLFSDVLGSNYDPVASDIWKVIDTFLGADPAGKIDAYNETTGSANPAIKIPVQPYLDLRVGGVTQEGQGLPETVSADNDQVPELGTRIGASFTADSDKLTDMFSALGNSIVDKFDLSAGITLMNDFFGDWNGSGDHTGNGGDGSFLGVNSTQILLDANMPFDNKLFDNASVSVRPFKMVSYWDADDHGWVPQKESIDFNPAVFLGLSNPGVQFFNTVGGWWDNWFGDRDAAPADPSKTAPQVGTDADESLIGDENDNTLKGKGGDDKLQGNAGDDVLVIDSEDSFDMTSGMTRGDIDGGAGQDLVKYGAYQQLGGWLQLENRGEHGAWGHDVTAVEHVQGNRFNNKVTDATGKANVLEGLGGDDELHGNGGEDALNGGPGEDKLFGGADADTINGGKGHDILQGEGGNDVLIVDGDDRMGIRDGSTKGHVDGGWGTDWVHIQDGADLNGWLQLESRGAHGPWGHDVTAVENARGNDLANKMVDATDRDNTLVGEGGDDELHGKGGSDALNGGPGDDVMHGGSGNDTLIVEGDDSLDLRPNSSEGDVHGGPGSNDWVKIQQGADLDGWLQLETVGHHGPWGHDVTGVENAEGNGGPNKIVDATHNDNVLHGKGGDDELHGKGGNDIIRGGSGQDVMHGDTGDDIIYAEPSDDPAAIEGGVGDDTLVLTDDQMSKSVWMSHTSGFEDVMYGA